jgi:FkbM family methyltransferase
MTMTQLANGKTVELLTKEPVDLEIIAETWERNVYKVAPTAGMRVMDVGAHKGYFSIFCALHGAIVTAFEPHPKTFAELFANITLNSMEYMIVPYKVAIWSDSAVLRLHQNPGNPGGSNVHRDRYECVGACKELPLVDVPAISFASALGEKEWDIVKLDCEGSEYEFLLKTPEESLSLIRYLTMEVHDWSGIEAYREMVEKLSRVFHVEGEGTNGEMFYYIHATRK